MAYLIIFVIIGLAVYINYSVLKSLNDHYKRQDELRLQKAIDNFMFWNGLFFKTAAKHKFDRKEFRELITNTYWDLPVRGGGWGSKGYPGFWENVFTTSGLDITYDPEGKPIDEDGISKKFADYWWLAFDQDIEKARTKT